MVEESKSGNQKGDGSESSAGEGALGQSGDPGRTPGSAEGDRETVEEDLRDKAGEEQK
jgi:hypothetical protein